MMVMVGRICLFEKQLLLEPRCLGANRLQGLGVVHKQGTDSLDALGVALQLARQSASVGELRVV